jgi:hypothetical protein
MLLLPVGALVKLLSIPMAACAAAAAAAAAEATIGNSASVKL